ncbi:MAG: right-handed parallel beta-helix repeat-containing protein [Paenibacillaceae bacterium]|nr:right-handed parallel beta-helix repeat-containing protein [Paenibacillaceae bacterium]
MGFGIKRVSLIGSVLLAAAVIVAGIVKERPAHAAAYAFTAVEDAYTKNGNGEDKKELKVQETQQEQIGYLKFTVSGVNEAVASAKLQLTATGKGTPKLRVYAGQSNAWSESSLSGTNAPAAGTLLGSYDAPIAKNETIAIDLNGYVTGNGTYTLIVKGANGKEDGSFDSSESSSGKPQLVLASASADVTPPAAVADLAASGAAANSLQLTWTAPGDDGTIGTAASYDVRYSQSPITAANWASATPASGVPAPAAAGTVQTMTLSGLDVTRTYYMALKTIDDSGNVSALSNVAGGSTTGAVVCDHTIPMTGNIIYYGVPGVNVTGIVYMDVQPGQIVCLQSGTQTNLSLRDFHGTPEAPITVINYDGVVNLTSTDKDYGLKLSTSNNVRITGSGDPDEMYGIRISAKKSGATGVNAKDYSTDYELDHIEVYDNASVGFLLKTDTTCDLTANRGHFTQYNTSVHDNYVHNVGNEGFYIGSSFYNNGETKTCNNVSTVLWPHPIEGLQVYNNIVDKTTWDGIQVGAATKDVSIHDNIVTNFSTLNVQFQSSGISLNPGTTGLLYNNYVKDGFGHGIMNLGRGDNDIFNNVVVNASGSGIFSDDRRNEADPVFDHAGVRIMNNTIVNPGSHGMWMWNLQTYGNTFYNNIVIQPNAGTTMPDNTTREFVKLQKGGIDWTEANNFYSTGTTGIGFVDAASGDYRLQSGSPAIDAGRDLSAAGVTFDLAGTERPQGEAFDIGAYEYVSP